MTRLKLVVLPVSVVVLMSVVGVALAGKPPSTPTPDPRFFPDLRTVVPQHLNLVNQGQEEYLRFSNGIANTGPGPWALRAEHDLIGDLTTTAYQEIRTSNAKYRCGTQPKQVKECYEVQSDRVASVFEYHPTHNHWHTADAARFEVHTGSPTGPLAGLQSFKVGFCLIEIYRLDGNAPTSDRTFWDCHGTHQGIGSGWVDQYHQATDGQQVVLTGLDNRDDYYLVSTTDPRNAFLETDETNNAAWVRFELSGEDGGNRKVTVTDNSDCGSPGLCGEGAPNPG
jgi:Lysyl oxidase